MEPKNWSTISKYRNVPEEEHLKPGVVVQSQVLPGKPEVLDRISKTNSVHVRNVKFFSVASRERQTAKKTPPLLAVHRQHWVSRLLRGSLDHGIMMLSKPTILPLLPHLLRLLTWWWKPRFFGKYLKQGSNTRMQPNRTHTRASVSSQSISASQQTQEKVLIPSKHHKLRAHQVPNWCSGTPGWLQDFPSVPGTGSNMSSTCSDLVFSTAKLYKCLGETWEYSETDGGGATPVFTGKTVHTKMTHVFASRLAT